MGSNKSTVVDVRVVSSTNHDLAKLVERRSSGRICSSGLRGQRDAAAAGTWPEDIPELFSIPAGAL